MCGEEIEIKQHMGVLMEFRIYYRRYFAVDEEEILNLHSRYYKLPHIHFV